MTREQVKLLPLLRQFSEDFGLVGGTAIALYLGHRRSIDFDLFTSKPFKNTFLEKKIKTLTKIDRVIVNKSGEFTCSCAGVKLTFFNYPFAIEYEQNFDHVIKMPDLITLAAMKAHALGGRAKWKDYVDLFFIKNRHQIGEITTKAKEIFAGEFNEKLFRIQLSYFDDIDYSEEVEFLPGFEASKNQIKKDLVEFSLS